MKFWEAMKALQEGKKVRCKDWDNKSFYDYRPDYFLHSDMLFSPGNLCSHQFSDDEILYCQWELYEEPRQSISFMEVVQGLKTGKRYKRPLWEDGKSFGPTCYCKNHVRINLYGGEPWDLEIEDLEATDWVEVT